MELAARLGGGHDAGSATSRSATTSTASLSRPRSAAIRRWCPDADCPWRACVRFLVPEGVLRSGGGLEEAAQVEGVVDARVYRRPGFEFGRFERGADRAGFVLATGDSKADALARADRAAALVR